MMQIKEAQEKVDLWINSIGKRYFDELTNMCVLTEEVGELSSLMARYYGEQSFKEGKAPTHQKDAIADELADIFWVVICLANQMDIDLTEAFNKNMDKKTNRDIERHQNNPKL